ncbi:SGNH/GDSL hydrolase family protein [Butyrivibrio sp. VCD2006]|uniref:SGNH/GDSL hydrolase family protein n=1 Tax=Butyrivibrio sp. VCD2006 TaxID=1280664 RepID=UPI0003FC59C2|nr:SGNH/GDSL hydrolase family protein [Butyrivibrio sp. VCD2006]
MSNEERKGPVAPKDPTKKRPYFYVMQDKGIFAAPQPDGRGIQFIYEDNGRLPDSAKLTGNVTDEELLKMLTSAEGFRKLVHSIGVSVTEDSRQEKVKFVFQMYGQNQEDPATMISKEFTADGTEQVIDLTETKWFDTDRVPGQIRFEFERSGIQAMADVCFYLNDGFEAPEQISDTAVDFESDAYKTMITKSRMFEGNLARLRAVTEKAKRGEDVTLSFIGGSITQGAGAIPINEKCYARIFADAFEEKYANGGAVNLIKAGVGGTPSELGMIRFERDILRDGKEKPDLVVIEFAVNDEGDETKGVCFESLVRKCLALSWKPAVIILFAVFSYDWNLQDRLSPVGRKYDIPMVSVLDAVSPQFGLRPEEGRVISKKQFFYDIFHPSNLGHMVMRDCLMDMVGAAEVSTDAETTEDLLARTPAIGADFEKVYLVDRKDISSAVVTEGAFSGTDNDLQRVEMDSEVVPVPEFPNNWHYDGSSANPEPFRMKISCKKLLLVMKDSGLNAYGTAEVYVDGRKVMDVDPLAIGWTHCNPLIILNGAEVGLHEVEIKMAKGYEDKKFTILGFGVV